MPESFKKLVAWQRALQLTVEVYRLTSSFPESERFGLTNQLRRAAVSVGSNIAEGYGRTSRGEYIQFLGHARGSCYEVETQLAITRELGFGTKESIEITEQLCVEVGKMLATMIVSLRKKS
jgi:four helix bundle protein